MLAGQSWRGLEGMVLEGGVRLVRFLDAGRGAWFLAEHEGGEPVAVLALAEPAGPVAERFREAQFYAHPNLLRCYGSGTDSLGGHSFVYAILERPEKRLIDVLKERVLSSREARTVGTHLAEGLSFLHERNRVCCNLDPSSVALVRGVWKVADFSELRAAGNGYGAETRRLVGLSPGTPPEAYEGIVQPAWDCWSLAVVLATSLTGLSASRTARRSLPEPFQAIASRALCSRPEERCRVEDIAEMLATPEGAPVERRRLGWFAPVLTSLAALAILVLLFLRVSQRPVAPTVRAAAPEQAPLLVLPDPPPPPVRAAPPPKPATPHQETASIQRLLDRWAEAGRTRNVEGQLACYAPRLDHFYTSRNVSREAVRRDRESAWSQLGAVRRFHIWDVSVTLTDDANASAVFNKSWEFVGKAIYSGQVRERMEFRKLDGEWKIVGQQELNVYLSRSS